MSRLASIDQIRDLIQRGIEQHRRGDTIQALSLYEQALALDANHANALCLAGIAEFQAGNRNRGLSLARRATDVQPDFVAGHAHLARMLESTGDHDGSLGAYGKPFTPPA